jgi:urea transport system ATP-binding protein
VPQGRDIFPRLTVAEKLEMGLATQKRGAVCRSFIFEMFPVLKDMLGRRAATSPGGQQQQLAIGRALTLRPKLLILDEPTEGIQPSIIKDIEPRDPQAHQRRRDGDPARGAVLRLCQGAGRSVRRDVPRRGGGAGGGRDMDANNVKDLLAV